MQALHLLTTHSLLICSTAHTAHTAHSGGAKVLDGLGEALQLSEHDIAPSRAVLWDYGACGDEGGLGDAARP